jgi:hypothetical protein
VSPPPGQQTAGGGRESGGDGVGAAHVRRLTWALRYAVREEGFLPVLSAGALLVAIGTLAYALGQGWNVVDAFYFAVATLTTSSIQGPELVLDDRWLKLFTVFYLLVGVGIVVEIVRGLGFAFVAVRMQDQAAKAAERRPSVAAAQERR